MKKTLLFILLLTLGINFNAKAHDFEAIYNGKIIYFKITSSTAPYTVAVTYQGNDCKEFENEYKDEISIPISVLYNEVEYYVTSIDDYAFYGCWGLTSVNIPNGVKHIGDYAFERCSKLTSIDISNSVTSIGDGAFARCLNLNSIVLPNSINSIGNSVFYRCSDLTSIDIPSSVTSIGEAAFYYCSGLTSINISNSVTSIGRYAFYYCSGLTSINISNSVTSIGRYAFCKCNKLTSINIPNSITSISDGVFAGCEGLTSITIPNSVTSIGSAAFMNCSSLKSINIPNSVSIIGNGTFKDCASLTSINIPNSVNSIGISAFYGCTSLTSTNIPNFINSKSDSVFVSGKMKDNRDGKSYGTIVIGTKEWMTENLNYDMDDRGSVHYPDQMLKASKEQIKEALKFYSTNKKNVTNLKELDLLKVINPYLDYVIKNHPKGWRYYNYYASKDACPEGWRLPTIDDMNELNSFISKELFTKMGFYKLAYWKENYHNPILEIRLGDYFGQFLSHWTSNEMNGDIYFMEIQNGYIFKVNPEKKVEQDLNDYGFCIRCLRDLKK